MKINNTITMLKAIATLFVVVWLFRYLSKNLDSLASVMNSITLGFWLAIIVTYLLIVTIQAAILIAGFEEKSKMALHYFTPAYLTNCLSTLVGFFIPSGASISKIFLLSRIFKFNKTDSMVVVARVANLQIVTNLVLGVTILFIYILLGHTKTDFYQIMMTVLVCLTLVFIVLMTLKNKKWTNVNRYKPLGSLFVRVLPHSKTQFYKVFIFHSLQQTLFALTLFIYFSSLNSQVEVIDCLILVFVGSLTLFISLTPGNIGIKEGVYFYLADILGLDSNLVVQILLFDRLFQVILISVLSIISGFIYRLIKL